MIEPKIKYVNNVKPSNIDAFETKIIDSMKSMSEDCKESFEAIVEIFGELDTIKVTYICDGKTLGTFKD